MDSFKAVEYDLTIAVRELVLEGGAANMFAEAPVIQFSKQKYHGAQFAQARRVENPSSDSIIFNYDEEYTVTNVLMDADGNFAARCVVRVPDAPAVASARSPSRRRGSDQPDAPDAGTVVLASSDVTIVEDEAFTEQGNSQVLTLQTSDGQGPIKVTLHVTFTLVMSHLVAPGTATPHPTAAPPAPVTRPTLFHVTICNATDLKCKEQNGADGCVELKRGSWSASTRRVDDTNNPVWNEKFVVPLSSTPSKASILMLKVFNHNKMLLNDYIGETELELTSPEYMMEGALNKVDFAVFVQLPLYPGGNKTKPEVGRLKVKLVPIYAGHEMDMKMYQQGVTDDDVYAPGEPPPPLTIEEEDAKAEAERLALERTRYEELAKRIENAQIQEGHYTVMVHIIEVSKLQSEDHDGSNDPFVQVTCFGQQRRTRMKHHSSAVFDDLFYFELNDIKRADLESGTVRVDVLDSDLGKSKVDLIGSFQIDVEYIYFLTDHHELYRQWVPLVDMENPKDHGVQGQLLLSVTIIGPGEKAPHHDRRKEIEAESASVATRPVIALTPPVQQQASLQDAGTLRFLVVNLYRAADIPPMDSGLGGKGVDAYVLVKFGEQPDVKCKAVTVKSQSSSGGLLSVAFNVRITIPVMVPSMSNRIEMRLMDKDLMADEAVQVGKYAQPFWAPVYGCAHPENSLWDYKTRMRYVPPRMSRYILKATIHSGSDLPSKQKLHVKRVAASDKLPGVVRWDELLTVGGGAIELPADAERLPDIFVYLVRDDENICLLRFKAKDVLRQGFDMSGRWMRFTRDAAIDRVKKAGFPGSLLLRLGMGFEELAQAYPWPVPVHPKLQPYTLFMYIYQARDLNPEDANGLLDPYLKIRFNGTQQTTEVVKATRNPSFFKIVRIDAELPSNMELWPEVMVEVWDHDRAPDPDDWVGTVRLQIKPQKVFRSDAVALATPPAPKWRQLSFLDDENMQGEVMLDYQVVLRSNAEEKLPDRPTIVPEMADYDILPIGLRDLHPKGLTMVSKPYLNFRVGDTQGTFQTRPSNRPSTINCNFIEEGRPLPTVIIPKLGGLAKELLGTVSIPLGGKIKRDGNKRYKPPGGEPFGGGDTSNPFAEEPIVFGAERKTLIVRRPTNRTPNLSPSMRSPGVSPPRMEPLTPPGQLSQRSAKDAGNQVTPVQDATKVFFGAEKLKTDLALLESPSATASKQPLRRKHSAEVTKRRIADSGEQYLVGRMTCEEEMEWVLDPTPFEEYPIYSGMKRLDNPLAAPFSRIGYFKGVVRVYERSAGQQAAEPLPFDEAQLNKKQAVEVRVYVLKASNVKGTGPDNRNNPYMSLKLGNQTLNDREKCFKDQGKELRILRCYSMDAVFPGPSKLSISLYSKEFRDELLGTTVIDLEDRWYSEAWRQGTPWAMEPDEFGDFSYEQQLAMERDLNTPGTLKMWLDIVPKATIDKHPKVRNWERPGDIMTDMTDLFLKLKLGAGSDWQSTEGASTLTLQAWDFDALYNDMLHEGQFDLQGFFSEALLNADDADVQLFAMTPTEEAVTFPVAVERFRQRLAEGIDKLEYGSTVRRSSFGGRSAISLTSTGGPRRSKGKKKIKMWGMFKEGMGFGPGPANSGWISLPGVGEICMTVQLMKKTDAERAPAGLGRNEPNANPALPPPEGRLDPLRMLNPVYALQACLGTGQRLQCGSWVWWRLDPLRMLNPVYALRLQACLGAGMFVKMTGTLCCLGIFALCVVMGPTITDVLLLMDKMPGGPLMMALLLCIAMCGLAHSMRTCARECGCCDGGDEDDAAYDIEAAAARRHLRRPSHAKGSTSATLATSTH
ncbi:hypothetical protein JKP88DRAFT_282166 [Tribonema minus]|uniref:C2 domain-containing protein n=1 Tax=Tribonema minus TaxID=303371 RepID=A0A835YL82_9STRA|nr:hypothetical protein JKP88DRAFT_282166 [Tribonema minus]